MTANLPAILEPLTASDCDCRGLPYMPLQVARLLDSDLVALSTGDEFKAALLLWSKAWSQVPAASLPDDDRILAKWAGYSLSEWKDLKEMALHGWVRCADGRLYHPVIADLAVTAYEKRKGQAKKAQSRWDADRARRAAGAMPRHGDPDAAASATAMQGKGKGEDKGEEEEEGRGAAVASPDDDEDFPMGDDPPPEEPKATAAPKPKAKRKPKPPAPATPSRGCRLAADWVAGEAERGYAAGLGLAEGDIDRIAEKFRNFWWAKAGQNAVKLDWLATWRNWVLTEVEGGRYGRRDPTGPAPGGRPSQRDESLRRMLQGAVAAVDRRRSGG